MLGEDKGENFERFAGGAWLSMIVATILGVVLWSLILFPLLALIPLTLPLGAWYGNEYLKRFRFRLERAHLFVRRGVIIYAYTLIPYENIQDVHVVQGYLERLFGVWSVIVFTATASARGSETVPGLSREGAENLRKAIFQKIKEAKHVAD
jgi:membrane protein YdbS with pleckstrin-like domain